MAAVPTATYLEPFNMFCFSFLEDLFLRCLFRVLIVSSLLLLLVVVELVGVCLGVVCAIGVTYSGVFQEFVVGYLQNLFFVLYLQSPFLITIYIMR